MAVSFQPKTEKQLAEEQLIPAGIYPFDVTAAENKMSKAGNNMIGVQLRVYLSDGRARSLNDYLMAKLQFKLFHFCAYTGLSRQYEAGTLDAQDCIGKSGFVKIGIQADKQGQFPDRNNVADYVRSIDGKMKAPGAVSTTKPQPTPEQLANRTDAAPDEDVPFN